MKVAFRVDASIEIGTGHVMRCLTLAESLRGSGAECVFLTKEHIGNMNEKIRDRGFTAVALPVTRGFDAARIEATASDSSDPAHISWLGSSWQEDAEAVEALVRFNEFDWLVIDHYALDYRWERWLRRCAKKILVLDDLADRVHDCDALVDQNLGRSEEDYAELVPQGCNNLVGPEFALLRPEFSSFRRYSLERRSNFELKKLLVFLGGIDKENTTGRVLQALLRSALPKDCSITVVMGDKAPSLKAVQEQCATMPWPTSVLINCKDMAQLMAESDLAIGAAGSTSWERCCLGLPSLIMVLADNQQPIANALRSITEARILQNHNLETDLHAEIERIVTIPDYLSRLSELAAAVCEGAGLQKVHNLIWDGLYK